MLLSDLTPESKAASVPVHLFWAGSGRGVTLAKRTTILIPSMFRLLASESGYEHKPALLVTIISIRSVHSAEQIRGANPNGLIFVSGNVKNEEPIKFCVVSRQRGDVPATLLSNHHPEIIDDREVILLSEKLASLGTKFMKVCLVSMPHFDVQGMLIRKRS